MLWNLLEDAAQTTTEQKGFFEALKENPTMLIITIVVLVALVGMFIWSTISNKKKRKEAEQMVTGLAIGDKVKTIGGVCGYVVEVNDAENTFVLETGTDAKKSYVKFDKGAIYKTAPANNNPAPAKAEAPAVEEKPAPAKKAKKAVKVEEPVVEEVKEEK